MTLSDICKRRSPRFLEVHFISLYPVNESSHRVRQKKNMFFLGVNTGGYIEVSGGKVFAEEVCVLSFASVSGSHAFSLPYHTHLQCASAKRST